MDNIPGMEFNSILLGQDITRLPPHTQSQQDVDRNLSKKGLRNDKEKGTSRGEDVSLDNQENKSKGGLSLSKDRTLDIKEKQKIDELKRIDSHVRAHEQAHIMAGGPYVRGGPSYSYIIGPDGNTYAVAGEVAIDVSPVPGDPDATIRKAEVIKRAALAPSDPSPQDRKVAAEADQMAMRARIEKLKKQAEEMEDLVKSKTDTSPQNNISPSYVDFSPSGYVGPKTLKRGFSTYLISQTEPSSSSIHFVV